MTRAAKQVGGLGSWLLPALVSGLLLGMAFPPVGASWLIWVGLVPLLWAIRHEERKFRAFFMGFVAGTIMSLLATRPLVSAHLWSGWQAGSAAELAARRSRQFVVLNVLWPVLALFLGLFWGAFSLSLSRMARGSLDRMAVLGPPLLILLTEWLRSLATWDFQWAFLGNAAIGVKGARQLGALGGVWLLSWLVVLVNVGVLALLSRDKRPRRWTLPAGIVLLAILVLLVGSWRASAVRSRLSGAGGLQVAALQYHRARNTFADYTPLGLEKAYLTLIGQVARGDAGRVELLVLPESIAYGVLSVDGSRTAVKPEAVHRSPDQWTSVMSSAMGAGESEFAVVLGLDTVEQGALHNSLAFWTKSGLQSWYHKQRLVPFAEYQPAVLSLFGMRGQTEYKPGRASRVGSLLGIRIGGFICQEVLTARIPRRSTRDGAQILVSGGNDSVFASPAVAQVHADLARLRAVETGRYVIRAMKTGISAIIDPTGEEIKRSPSAEPLILVDRVTPLDALTPYVRFGDWPLALAALVVLGGAVLWLREDLPIGREASRPVRTGVRRHKAAASSGR
jgi:apolipoprotein N-acyltransferase